MYTREKMANFSTQYEIEPRVYVFEG